MIMIIIDVYSRSDWLETPLFAIPVNFVQETQRQHVKARVTGNGLHHNTLSKTEVELVKNKQLELASTIDPFKNH